jgi:manganese transport protein
MPYLSSDARRGGLKLDLRRDFRRSVISLGLVFGAYSAFILVAGGFALYPLAHHAEIETVHQAGQVLDGALFPGIRSLGPIIFSAGLLIAAMTTMIVSVQVIIYTSLDMLRRPWSFSVDNRWYRRLLVMITMGVGIAAPLWSFPAMLKVLLLMGVNVLVIPIVISALFYLINRREVMGANTASPVRNIMLAGCIGLSVVLAIQRGPDLLQMLAR